MIIDIMYIVHISKFLGLGFLFYVRANMTHSSEQVRSLSTRAAQ